MKNCSVSVQCKWSKNVENYVGQNLNLNTQRCNLNDTSLVPKTVCTLDEILSGELKLSGR